MRTLQALWMACVLILGLGMAACGPADEAGDAEQAPATQEEMGGEMDEGAADDTGEMEDEGSDEMGDETGDEAGDDAEGDMGDDDGDEAGDEAEGEMDDEGEGEGESMGDDAGDMTGELPEAPVADLETVTALMGGMMESGEMTEISWDAVGQAAEAEGAGEAYRSATSYLGLLNDGGYAMEGCDGCADTIASLVNGESVGMQDAMLALTFLTR